MVDRKVATLMLALSVAMACEAQASTVALTDSSWHSFDVDPLTATSGGLEWIDINDGSALDFTINLAAPALVTVVDGGFSGDRFQVFDNGTALGLTSVAPNSYPKSVSTNFDAALAGGYSTASFLLGAGVHDLTGTLFTSALDSSNQPLNATVGALRLEPVPLPGAALLLLSGGGLLPLLRRRRAQEQAS